MVGPFGGPPRNNLEGGVRGEGRHRSMYVAGEGVGWGAEESGAKAEGCSQGRNGPLVGVTVDLMRGWAMTEGAPRGLWRVETADGAFTVAGWGARECKGGLSECRRVGGVREGETGGHEEAGRGVGGAEVRGGASPEEEEVRILAVMEPGKGHPEHSRVVTRRRGIGGERALEKGTEGGRQVRQGRNEAGRGI